MGAELMAWHVRWETFFFCISLPGWWWWGSSSETVPHHDPETPCVERRTTQKKVVWRAACGHLVGFVLAFPSFRRLPCPCSDRSFWTPLIDLFIHLIVVARRTTLCESIIPAPPRSVLACACVMDPLGLATSMRPCCSVTTEFGAERKKLHVTAWCNSRQFLIDHCNHCPWPTSAAGSLARPRGVISHTSFDERAQLHLFSFPTCAPGAAFAVAFVPTRTHGPSNKLFIKTPPVHMRPALGGAAPPRCPSICLFE